jgi:hypothetical protein
MARSGPLLSEAQWKKIAPLPPKPRKNRRGGRPWIENLVSKPLDVLLKGQPTHLISMQANPEPM